MIRFIKRLVCRHKHMVPYKTELVRMPVAGNRWTTQHHWECKRCGKVMRGK